MLRWLATYSIAQNSFEIVPVASITFTGPATAWLAVFSMWVAAMITHQVFLVMTP
ncbi:hypothetical protein [Boseongicola aestuarii]|uniref:hypothetical protein n=1 Tax=Boseongicola aestuarii TaxID=1470561 RepID=UPI001594FB5C|nr:hypothetical protein [Boseongicola aestuarii]